jgi:hypothetical protein
LQVLSPGGAGAVDVEVTTAGGTSPAVAADQFTYPGGSFAVEASPSLYWDFALDGYDQWASASASALSGCTGDGDGTVCSAGTQPVLEVLDTTGAHAGWSLSAYVTGGSLPAGSVLDFDGAGSAALGTSAQAALEAFPYPSAVPTTICDANSGCLPALPAASCSHPAVGITSCPADPVDVLDGASAGAQVDLYSAAAGSGSASICFATGTATAAGCLGAVPDAFFDLGLPASAASGSHSATTIVLTVSSGP